MTIRLRLTLLFVALLAAVSLGQGLFISSGMRQTLHYLRAEDARAKARQVADYLAPSLARAGPFVPDKVPDSFFDDGSLMQLRDASGAIRARSDNLGARELPALAQLDTPRRIELESRANGEDQYYLLLDEPLTGPRGQSRGRLQIAYPLLTTERMIEELMGFLVLTGVLTVIVAFALGLFLAGRALAPVSRMIASVRRMGVADLHSRLPVPEPPQDEIDRLGATFNALFERLALAFDLQRRFVGDASHELKSPLTAIKGHLQLILKRGAGRPEEVAGWAGRALSEVDRLTRLVESLLDLARLDSEGPGLGALRQTDLTELLRDVAEPFRLLRPGLRFELAPARGVSAALDADRFRQVLVNLVDNACRATPDGGTIALRAGAEPERHGVYVEVSDTGTGIAPDALPHLFDRFYRAETSRARRSGGTGLGLAISKGLVEAHGGTIEVRSAPGRGSTFTVRLPSAPEGGR